MSSRVTSAPTDHIAAANQYAHDVVNGHILAASWVKFACQRHLNDLKRQQTADFPYRFDPDPAGRICRFAEHLPIWEGPRSGETLKLQPWQQFLLCNLFGWLVVGGKRDGKRRFRRCYIEVPRGNGKSALMAVVGLYMLAADGEGGAQVVAAAASAKQAHFVFKPAREQALRATDLMSRMGVAVYAHSIVHPRTASTFKVTSADRKANNGDNLHCAIVDELHLHRDRVVYDAVETGMAKRDNSMMLVITTAGTDTSGICYEFRSYVTSVLAKVRTDESVFGIVYTLPEGMDWRDSAGLHAANPGWEVTIDHDFVEGNFRKAKSNPASENNFRTKHLCEWTAAGTGLFDMGKYNACADPDLDLDKMPSDRPCHIGCDLANKSDLASVSIVFPRTDVAGKTHYDVFVKSFLNEHAVQDDRNPSYPQWEKGGHIEVTEGNETDYQVIADHIVDLCDRFDVRSVGFDPYNAAKFAQDLAKLGVPMVEVAQTVRVMSEPTKEVVAAVESGRYHHDGCPVTGWAFSNITGRYDTNDNVKPHKPINKSLKTDPAVATIIAVARSIGDPPPPPPKKSPYTATRGLTVLNVGPGQ